MKKPFSTQQTPSNISAILEILRDTPARLESLSEELPAEQLRKPLGMGERSLIETLAHLLNSEARSSEAIYLALLVDEPLLVGVHSERDFGKLLRYDQFELSELLDYFKFRRTALLRVLVSLTEAQWSRSVREEGKQRKESVYWRARAMAMHESEHLATLEKKLGGKEAAP
ncbi:MAG: DinB family protein [Chloroflexota bacterium]